MSDKLNPYKYNGPIFEGNHDQLLRKEKHGLSLITLGLMGLASASEEQQLLTTEDLYPNSTAMIRIMRDALIGRKAPIIETVLKKHIDPQQASMDILHRLFKDSLWGNDELVLPSLSARELIRIGIISNPQIIQEIEQREKSRQAVPEVPGEKRVSKTADNRLQVKKSKDAEPFKIGERELDECLFISETYTRSLPVNSAGQIIEANQNVIYALGIDRKTHRTVMLKIKDELVDPHMHVYVSTPDFEDWERVAINDQHLKSFSFKPELLPRKSTKEDIALILTHVLNTLRS